MTVKAQHEFIDSIADRVEKGEPFARAAERKLVAGMLRAWARQIPDAPPNMRSGAAKMDPGYVAIHFACLVNGQGRIVRVGTCGGVGDVSLGDLLLAQAASSDSNFNRLQFGGHDLAACANFDLLTAVANTASRQGIALRVASVFSTDCFYGGDPDLIKRLLQHHIVAIDMESAGLYGLAMREGIQAVSVLTVSDHLQRGEHMPTEQREQGLSRMIALVLDSLQSMSGD